MMITVSNKDSKKKNSKVNYKIVELVANLLFWVPIVLLLISMIIIAIVKGYWQIPLMFFWFFGSAALTLYAHLLKYEHDFGYTILNEEEDKE